MVSLQPNTRPIEQESTSQAQTCYAPSLSMSLLHKVYSTLLSQAMVQNGSQQLQ